MKFGSAEDFYIAYAEYVQELEDRAGIPRPCPRCGGMVFHVHNPHYATDSVRCNHCEYRTIVVKGWQDAWREHERLCREAEEDEDRTGLTFLCNTEEKEGEG